MLEPRNVLRCERGQLDHLVSGFDLGPRQILGLGAIDTVYARRVDGQDAAFRQHGLHAEVVTVRPEFAIRLGRFDQIEEPEHADHMVFDVQHALERVGRKILRVLFHVLDEPRDIHAAHPEDERHRPHLSIGLPPFDIARAGTRRDVGIAARVNRDAAQNDLPA